MTRILLTRHFPEKVIEAARESFDVTLREAAHFLPEEEAAQALRDYDAVLCTLGDRFNAEALAQVDSPRTRVLANFGVGYNHIDVAAARAKGIAVSNTPDVVTESTADIGMALILATCRRIGEGERIVRAGKWPGWNPTQMLGTHVSGKTVGIVGMGRIGQAVAQRCHYGFGMPVLFYNRSLKGTALPALQVDSLTELMAESDIVVVTVPATPETRGLIGAEELAAMRPTGFLINIARGDIVDEAALIDALQRRAIAGAGLDVFAREPEVPEALMALENAVLTPHLGTAALETREAMGLMALENIRAWSRGEALPQALEG
ncbi:2-hydroxyacid dehydrogenase [Pseudoroseicyclus aestuarii]|uniref:Hydroxypyruvate reductase/gluconate 2-dehydrogenase n=1 Tax=Pseudoroseicyclus aestuarii TaxID=1795041 RepID=A0A318T1Q6_9RHOB|nr:D-glycerate dehydrogenase [Pseudoroseicyclus aestuarii]PYE84124.1 hydroxypyruvate reductase/gluconate 2-dehydrogenase [Pseudoroseicyclus aestuarii]